MHVFSTHLPSPLPTPSRFVTHISQHGRSFHPPSLPGRYHISTHQRTPATIFDAPRLCPFNSIFTAQSIKRFLNLQERTYSTAGQRTIRRQMEPHNVNQCIEESPIRTDTRIRSCTIPTPLLTYTNCILLSLLRTMANSSSFPCFFTHSDTSYSRLPAATLPRLPSVPLVSSRALPVRFYANDDFEVPIILY